MEQQQFEMFMQRFDGIDHAIKSYHDRMDTHVDADSKIHTVVQRHATYWKLMSMGIPVVGSFLAKKMGWV